MRFAQVISSGFGEVDEGKELQEQLVAAAREGGMRLIGPNCLGLYTPRGKVTFTETWPEEAGHVGVISQSGGLGTDIVRRGITRGLKFSGVVTVGNCADVGPNELLEFYLADDQTRVIGMYIEAAQDGRRLFEMLREAKAAKPVVILKGGRTRLGKDGGRIAHGLARGRRSRLGRAVPADRLRAGRNARRIPGRAARVPGAHAAAAASDARDRCSSATAAARACWRPILLPRSGLEVTPFGKPALDALAALKLPPGTSITNPVDTPVGTLQQDDGGVAEKILEIIYGIARPQALVMHLNLSAFVGRTKTDVLGNLMQIALRVQSRYPGTGAFRAGAARRWRARSSRSASGNSARARWRSASPFTTSWTTRPARSPRSPFTSDFCTQEA